MKNKLILFLTLFFLTQFKLLSQRDITMSSNGIGNTEENAVKNAIISSMNQVFGMFYSSNTNISNDSLKWEDFTTINRGNLKELKIKSTDKISENKWFASINITISLDKIEKYYENIGQTLQYEGSLFSLNIQIMELNDFNETKSICNMLEIANDISLNLFDYEFSNSEPISIDEISEKWLINFKVKATLNDNILTFRNVILRTLDGLALTQSEIDNYLSLGKKTYLVSVIDNGTKKYFHLRSSYSVNMISNFLQSWEGYVRSFDIQCDKKKVRGNSILRETSSRTNKNLLNVNYKNKINVKNIVLSYENENITFQLPNPTDTIGNFDWYEYFSIAELEKIDVFKLEPNKLLQFKEGGFVILESNGHGLILSPFELSRDQYLKNSDITIGLFNDWEIPSIDDFALIKKNMYLNHFCSLLEHKEYLTSRTDEDYTISFHSYNSEGVYQEKISEMPFGSFQRVRFIRRF